MNEILPNISIDNAIFGFANGELKILLIKRDKQPEFDRWSLPGGYVYCNENMDDASRRLLQELTGISNLFLSRVDVFGDTDRYPDRRVISVLYCALVKPEQFELLAGAHAKKVKWFRVKGIKKLPFDHNVMIETALNWLRDEIWRKPVLINLLPEKFPLNQMHDLFQTFLHETIDNRNFRKKVISQELVERLNEKTKGGKQRPAYLYRMKKK
ncbi:NUDIX domain-containing protein [Prolixibacter sp. NT017]|uniref:NUDIX hydrolase n=1 Tax=Prolixibacter sp. NT017 TaxID=2652390 RepID=UPI00126EE747|nr:NUDIX domain-containing protein [Prolixibacter sp. NT017]GET25877.1 DNA mismatch repair protein MutT [Prolixibacter sp. NT017]